MTGDSGRSRSPDRFVIAFVILVLAVGAGFFWYHPRREEQRSERIRARSDTVQFRRFLESARAANASMDWIRLAPTHRHPIAEVPALPARILFWGTAEFASVHNDSADLLLMPMLPLALLRTSCPLKAWAPRRVPLELNAVSDTIDLSWDFGPAGTLGAVVDVKLVELVMVPSVLSARQGAVGMPQRVLSISGECVWLKRIPHRVAALMNAQYLAEVAAAR